MALNSPFADGLYPEDRYLDVHRNGYPSEAAFMAPGVEGFFPPDPFFEAHRNGYPMESGLVHPGMPSFVPNHLENPYASASFESRLKYDMILRRATECTHRNRMRRSMINQRQPMAPIFPPMMPPMCMGPGNLQDFAAAADIRGGLSDQHTLRSPPSYSAAVSLTSTPDAIFSTPDEATSMPMHASEREQRKNHQYNTKRNKSDKNCKNHQNNCKRNKSDNNYKKDKKRKIEEVSYSSFPCNVFEAELRQAEMEAVDKTESLVSKLEQQAKKKNLSVLKTTNILSTTVNYMTKKENTQKDRNDPGGTIFEPKHCDVLLGRGATIDRHPGNKYFRRLLVENKKEYARSIEKMGKFHIATSIVHHIQSLGGQFIEEDPDTCLWHPVDDDVARLKASRGLRRP